MQHERVHAPRENETLGGPYCSIIQDLAAALRRTKVEVKPDVEPEMQHVFHFLAGVAAEADDAIRRPAARVRPKLGLT